MTQRFSPRTVIVGLAASGLLLSAGMALALDSGSSADAMVGVWGHYDDDTGELEEFLIVEKSLLGGYPVTLYGEECSQDLFHAPGERSLVTAVAADATPPEPPAINPDPVLGFSQPDRICGHITAHHDVPWADALLTLDQNQNHIVLDATGDVYVPANNSATNLNQAAAFFDAKSNKLAPRFVGEWVDQAGTSEKLKVDDKDGHYVLTIGPGCIFWVPLLDYGWFGVAENNNLGIPTGEIVFSIKGEFACPAFPDGIPGWVISYQFNEGPSNQKSDDSLTVYPGGVVLVRAP